MTSRENIRHALALFAVLAHFSACKRSNDPDAVANAFVDAYYIEFNLTEAKGLAVGGALKRLQSEEKLVDEAREQVQVEPQKARVYYGTPKRRAVGDDMVHFAYDLDIRRSGSKVTRTAVVMVAKQEGRWVVVGFREAGAGGANVRTSTEGRP